MARRRLPQRLRLDSHVRGSTRRLPRACRPRPSPSPPRRRTPSRLTSPSRPRRQIPSSFRGPETQAVLSEAVTQIRRSCCSARQRPWVDSGASLAAPLLKNSTEVQAVVTTGDDGSKSLYTFDMTRSPNEVNRTLLMSGSGAPMQASVAISSRDLAVDGGLGLLESMASQQRRGLTQDDWPSYNGTGAPASTRSNYAVAQDTSGLVVITGGTPTTYCACSTRGRMAG